MIQNIEVLHEKLINIQTGLNDLYETVKELSKNQAGLSIELEKVKAELKEQIRLIVEQRQDKLWEEIRHIRSKLTSVEKWQYKVIGIAGTISFLIPIIVYFLDR